MKNKESICIDINCPLGDNCIVKDQSTCWFDDQFEGWRTMGKWCHITPFEVFVLKERWAQRKKNSS